ncbi:TonB-dependent receptor plug domain-containing protein, partial [Acinetobacter baumannii]
SETKISNEETLVVTTNRSASNLWESPATIQVIDQQTLQNSTNASIADNLQDIPGVEITDNSLAGRKQIRIRGWICPYISRHLLSLNPLQARCRRYSRGER